MAKPMTLTEALLCVEEAASPHVDISIAMAVLESAAEELQKRRKSAGAAPPRMPPGRAHVDCAVSLRDHFAGLALQGCLAHPNAAHDPETFAKLAVALADALVRELAGEEGPVGDGTDGVAKGALTDLDGVPSEAECRRLRLALAKLEAEVEGALMAKKLWHLMGLVPSGAIERYRELRAAERKEPEAEEPPHA